MSQEMTDRLVFEKLASCLSENTLDVSWLPANAEFAPERLRLSIERAKRMMYEHLSALPEQIDADAETKETLRALVDKLVFETFGNGLTSALGLDRE